MSQGRLLCIQPTGHGKSLLYQIPAVLLPGLTLVISPLLALMRDQLFQLKNRFNIEAASVNTDQSEEENESARQKALSGKIRILFIAPEQLDHLDRFKFLLRLPISLLVVDEAHCISTWGHDFRPSYRQILKLSMALSENNPDIKLLALTATANEKTERDITQQLTLSSKKICVLRSSMNRANIALEVLHTNSIAQKLFIISQLLKKLSGSGLIYCATRENTELVAEYLTTHHQQVVAYHAGIHPDEKRRIQEAFIADDYPLIAATNALGMGIDKPNLRFIIHFDFPGSITAYYQEVGRAGRDGLPSRGILLYSEKDSRIQKHFIDSAQPSQDDFNLTQHTIQNAEQGLNLSGIKRQTGLHPTKINVIVSELMEQGFLKKKSEKGVQLYSSVEHINKQIDLSRYINQREARYEELGLIQNYATQTSSCLMSILRKSLGDLNVDSCGQCSICSTPTFKFKADAFEIASIDSWLSRRTVPITLHKKYKQAVIGLAVLDAKLRSPEFIHFMHARSNQNLTPHITPTLWQLIQACLTDLKRYHTFGSVIALPSRTWYAREEVTKVIADFLNAPLLREALYWETLPKARQGELLNNDQRQFNVDKQLRVNTNIPIPKGVILLLDDYTGSGATLNEAARALTPFLKNNQLILPFTFAAVKWHLGKKGMV